MEPLYWEYQNNANIYGKNWGISRKEIARNSLIAMDMNPWNRNLKKSEIPRINDSLVKCLRSSFLFGFEGPGPVEEEREFPLTCLKDHRSSGFDNSECGQTLLPIYLANLPESPLEILSFLDFLWDSTCIIMYPGNSWSFYIPRKEGFSNIILSNFSDCWDITLHDSWIGELQISPLTHMQTIWNLNITPLKRIIFQTSIVRFHVSFQECILKSA